MNNQLLIWGLLYSCIASTSAACRQKVFVAGSDISFLNSCHDPRPLLQIIHISCCPDHQPLRSRGPPTLN